MSRSVSFVACVALAATLVATPAAAHESADRVLGTVASVTPERIVVRASDGHEVAFKVTPETRFTRGEKPAGRADVRVGERAVIHGKRAGGDVEAVRVRLAPPAKKR